jgi:hypothetical protein
VIAALAALALQPFRFERTLSAPSKAPLELVPDGQMYAHAQSGFADLRIVDARGRQVPWRPEPQSPSSVRALPVLDQGTRDGRAVARVRTPVPVDRVTLVVPDRNFVGLATASGSSDGKTWTRLSTTQIYDVNGATSARSTTVLLPRNDFHYLELRVTHVHRIDGVTVATTPAASQRTRLPARVTVRRGDVVVDVGHAKVPVDELRVDAANVRYDRPFSVFVRGEPVTAGELVRLGAPTTTVIPVDTRTRYVRLHVENGDDPPLRGLHVTAWSRPRPLLLEGGHPGPFVVYYGAPSMRPPVYEWERLPERALHLGAAQPASLGPERPNTSFHVVDTCSFFAKHRSLVSAALALCAAAVIAAGALALRRT